MSNAEVFSRIDIKIGRSYGRNKLGAPVFFVRPSEKCFNRSRRFVGYDKMYKGIDKWFSPTITYFVIDDRIIGSNTAMNALREYHRVCEKEKIGKYFEVKTTPTHDPLHPLTGDGGETFKK